jgi:release factor glutamine methyltransferase
LLLTLLSLYPNATGQGCDISKGALEVAKKNADSLKLSDRVHFHHRPWDECEGLFDLIISNPPYISQKHMDVLMADVGEFEPHTALFGGSDGLEAYKNLFPYAKTHLKKEGLLVCEHGFDQRESLCELANQEGLSVLDQYDDIGANPRCLVMNVAAG